MTRQYKTVGVGRRQPWTNVTADDVAVVSGVTSSRSTIVANLGPNLVGRAAVARSGPGCCSRSRVNDKAASLFADGHVDAPVAVRGQAKQAGEEGREVRHLRALGCAPLYPDGAAGAKLLGGDGRGHPGGLLNHRGDPELRTPRVGEVTGVLFEWPRRDLSRARGAKCCCLRAVSGGDAGRGSG